MAEHDWPPGARTVTVFPPRPTPFKADFRVTKNVTRIPTPLGRRMGVPSVSCVGVRLTVKNAEPTLPARVAEMVEVPTPAPEARPEALIVATDVFEEAQLTLDVRSAVVPSE